jgi:hypothetical protein
MRYRLCAFLLLALSAPAQDRTLAWREDLRVLTETYSAKGNTVDLHRGVSTRGQKDFDKLYPNFRRDISALESDIPSLADPDVVLRLMKVIASANVAHNIVQTPLAFGFFPRLPLTFAWYSDGLAIIAASEEYAAAIGTRVAKFGSKTPEQLTAELAPFIAHENEIWLRESAAGLLRTRAILEHTGVADKDGSVILTLQKPDAAEPFTLTVKTADPRTKLISASDALHIPVVLSRSHPSQIYWHQYLPDSATLYIQYNACRNDPQLPFTDFVSKVLADADAHTVKRVVIDLRFNGGGDSRIIRPLKEGLASRLSKLGPVYVLIGPHTFSSAMDNAMELRTVLHARLAGESTGGKPSSYGEVKVVELPNSKLKVQFTSKFFGSHKASEAAELVPDIVVRRTLADALGGRDPVLEAVLH